MRESLVTSESSARAYWKSTSARKVPACLGCKGGSWLINAHICHVMSEKKGARLLRSWQQQMLRSCSNLAQSHTWQVEHNIIISKNPEQILKYQFHLHESSLPIMHASRQQPHLMQTSCNFTTIHNSRDIHFSKQSGPQYPNQIATRVYLRDSHSTPFFHPFIDHDSTRLHGARHWR